MKYKIEITEKMKAVVEVKARSVTEALAKAERKYFSEQDVVSSLEGVEFTAILNGDKSVKVEA